jgi:hypothetical protein
MDLLFYFFSLFSSDMDCSKLQLFSFSATKILFICNQSLHSLNPISLSTTPTPTTAHSLCHPADEIILPEQHRPKPSFSLTQSHNLHAICDLFDLL